jgi:ATP-binding cassette, subfamily B (MDR/TAP), member 1
VEGRISFRDVDFNYKSREIEGGAPVLNNLNLDILPGKTHALVGPSGCGKSSTIGLVERFYDPKNGAVLLDGVDLRDLNVRWLRSQIGHVGQMPTLFRATISENIAFGAAVDFCANVYGTGIDGSCKRREVSDEEVVAAAKLANAHSFITKLPEGYGTVLGERGALLSGGQKQRICIARAVVRNPKILLLDEATSALDAQSERAVQEALERASEGRTTILVAHRLSTVRNADTISVLKSGEVVESGRHDELMKQKDGAYHDLVKLQEFHRAATYDLPMESESVHSLKQQSAFVSAESATISAQESTTAVVNRNVRSAEDLPSVDKGVIARTFRVNREEWPYIVLGMIGAAMAGSCWPLRALVFSEVTNLLGDPTKSKEISTWASMFVVLGGVAFVGNFLQFGMLGICGERLIRKMRILSFRSLLRQEIAFFDEAENSVGALTSRLATEATLVKGITGDSLGVLTLIVSTVTIGLAIAFSACWRLALVVLVMIPLMALGGYIQTKKMSGFDSGSRKEFAKAGAVASEAVDGIRTISSLGIQDLFIDRYGAALLIPLKNGDKAANVAGLSFGFAEGFLFVVFAVSFLSGSKFVQQRYCSFVDLMKALTALLFTAISLGGVAAFTPDLSAAAVSATNIFRLLDRESRIDPSTKTGKYLNKSDGKINIESAEFEYPSRPDVAVLRGLSLSVSPGKTIALVGQSGCGKSTVVALMERFYDVRAGNVLFEGEQLPELNVQNARKYMAFVQQEPDLFNRTIKENIAYGLPHGNGMPVTDEQIVQAARAANAHDFVIDLPLGYETVVGERGGSLSGGQRQRIAIARSLVRQPRLLLLDEATSALDARSERIVQDALDEARQGRTTIVIAHRLSSVKDADAIAMVSRGKVAELGTHEELMARDGLYADLIKNQMTESADDV